METCVYQGSFNPIHNAHLEAAKFVAEKFGFEKIVFIPAFIPPHKPKEEFDGENAFHRLNMVELAVSDYPNFDVSAIEYMRNKPSYTYETIMQIKEIVNCEGKINFIIGTDAFRQIKSWYKTEELKKHVRFILFVREENFNEADLIDLKSEGYEYILMEMPYINISSSEIREKISKNEEFYDKVPLKVAEYIEKNNVYKIR